jgi:hypothetical protein
MRSALSATVIGAAVLGTLCLSAAPAAAAVDATSSAPNQCVKDSTYYTHYPITSGDQHYQPSHPGMAFNFVVYYGLWYGPAVLDACS